MAEAFKRVPINQQNLIMFYYAHPIDTTKDMKFRFKINPAKLNVKRGKKEKYVLTKAGWERQYFDEDLRSYEYSGTTGVFREDEQFLTGEGILALRAKESFDITNTEKWKHFQKLKDFFDDIQEGNMIMAFWGEPRPVVGSMNDFNYQQNADDPFKVDYNFRFTGIPTLLPSVEARYRDLLTAVQTTSTVSSIT